MELYFKRSFLILAFELCDKCEDVKSKWKEVDRIRLNIYDISYNIKRKLRYLIIHFFFLSIGVKMEFLWRFFSKNYEQNVQMN